MAISTEQKLDYLWKKLGYGATKTDTNAIKKAPNEAIASPLLLRGDKVWQQSSSIPTVLPGSNTAPVTVYTTSLPFETTEDNTATTSRTWKTNLTDWIPPEIGSTYQAKVYIHTSGDAGNAASSGTQVFATGSGNDDEWFFDYQSGVLHFIGDNLPNGVSFSGKSVYISGGRYTGVFGVGSAGGEDAFLGNLTISNVTITSTTSADPIILDAEDGIVKIAGTTGFVIPLGNTAQRPGTPESGTLRYNSSTQDLEIYDGSVWSGLSDSTSVITSETFSGNGVANVFTLSTSATTNTVFVSINGTLQQPTAAYTVSGTTLTFAEAPATGDTVEVRKIFESQTVASLSNSTGNAYIQTNDSGTVDVVGKETTVTGNLTVTGDIKSDSFYFVKRSTNTSISYPGSYGAVTIDYEDAGDDYGSTDAMWSSATDRFTPTVAGLWFIRASIDAYSGATQEGGIFIEKNGTTVAQTSHIGFIRGQLVTHLYMNGSTDYLQFKSYTQSATTRSQQNENCFFEALLVKQAQ